MLSKLLIVLVFLLGSTKAFGVDCKVHKIYCKIVELQPNADKDWAMEFSNLIFKYSKQYKLDPIRSVAIAAQESSLREKNRKQSIIVVTEVCGVTGECTKISKVVNGYTDLSIWQFHIGTVHDYDMDPIRLMEDLEYATEFHFKLLKIKMALCKNLKEDAWTCYHSKTPRLRKQYKRLVDRFFY